MVLASKEVKLEPVKQEPEPKPKEEHVEKSKLEEQVEEYIMLPIPETLSAEDIERIHAMNIKRSRKAIKKKKGKIIKKKPLIKKPKTIKKKIKKKPKPKKKVIKKKTKPKVNKAQLKKQLNIIENKYRELKEKGFSDDELKAIKDKIDVLKKGLG